MSEICDDPEKIVFENHGKNTYAKYKDTILVKAHIRSPLRMEGHGYFLIDSDDEEILTKNKFDIYLKTSCISIFVKSHEYPYLCYKTLLTMKYSTKNKDEKYKYYVLRKYNPFDLRKKNLVKSMSRKNYKSDILGVNYDKLNKAWTAIYSRNGLRIKRSFSINKYGETISRELAIKKKKEWEELYLAGKEADFLK